MADVGSVVKKVGETTKSSGTQVKPATSKTTPSSASVTNETSNPSAQYSKDNLNAKGLDNKNDNLKTNKNTSEELNSPESSNQQNDNSAERLGQNRNNYKENQKKPQSNNIVNTAVNGAKFMANPDNMTEEEQQKAVKDVATEVASRAIQVVSEGAVPAEISKPILDKAAETKIGQKTVKKLTKDTKKLRTILIISIAFGVYCSFFLIALLVSPIILISKTVGDKFSLNDKTVLNIDNQKDLTEIAGKKDVVNEYDDKFSITLADGTELCDLIDCGEETGGSSSSEVASYISSETTYIVQAGDTLESIAAKFGVSVESLKAINNLADDYILSEGAILKIPLATLPIDIAEGKSWQDYAGNRRFDMNGTAACYNMNGDKLSDTGCNHGGIDFNRLGIDTGTPVYSLAKGTVYEAVYGDSTYGFYVSIGYDTDGDGKYDYYSLYAHLSKISVSKDDAVNAGQKVGEVGSTGRSSGPHLHFEIRNDDYNRVDPAPILDKIEKGESVLSTAV